MHPSIFTPRQKAEGLLQSRFKIAPPAKKQNNIRCQNTAFRGQNMVASILLGPIPQACMITSYILLAILYLGTTQ